MSTFGVAVEGRVSGWTSRRRQAGLTGSLVLSLAMVSSGALAWIFHVLVARSLGPEQYGRIAVLWAAMFLSAVVLFRPLEQTLARGLSERLAHGEGASGFVRAVARLYLCTALAVIAAVAIAWRPLTDHLFLGSQFLTVLLAVGVVGYGCAYLVRGLASGSLWFRGYGLGLLADGVARLALALPLLVIASTGLAGTVVAVTALAGVVVPLVVGRRRLWPLLRRTADAPIQVRGVLAFAAPASAITAADQVLINGAPILVMLAGGADAGSAAAIVFAATMLVRVPVYLFQGVATSLLPGLTGYHARGDSAAFRRTLLRVTGTICLLVPLFVAAAAAAGPSLLALAFGSEFAAGRLELALLAAGVGFYLLLATASQGLLALARVGHAAVAWWVAVGGYVGVYLAVEGEQVLRVAVGFAAGTLAGVLAVGLMAARVLRR